MAEERLDIYDEAGVHLGSEARSEVHRLGLWHQTFHCWIYRKDGEQIDLLFQKRHPQKDTCPNLLDITSAGHLLAGEIPEDGVRELEEELGLSVAFSALTSLGTIRDVTSAPGIMDKEICHVFLFECDQPLSAYTLQEEEVVGLLWVKLDEVEKLFKKEIPRVSASGFLLKAGEGVRDCELQLREADFVPHEAHYYQQVFDALKRHV